MEFNQMTTEEPLELFTGSNSTFSAGNIEKYVLGTQTSSPQPIFNATGFFIDDEVETGLNDWETVFLSCFITLLPLVVSVIAAFAVRIAWLKYKRRMASPEDDDDFLREESSDIGHRPLHTHLLNSEAGKCDETQVSIGTEEMEVVETPTINSCHQNHRGDHSSTNGSIITMTLKNNHLIVEKEERNDLEEDSRETTMKYSPNARDGVFVVEVQQGMRRSPGSGKTVSCLQQEAPLSISDQRALVHNPPDRYSDDENLEEFDDNEFMDPMSPNTLSSESLNQQSGTGFTQSNQSLTSSIRRSYSNGNQQGYGIGSYGYPAYNGYSTEDPPSQRPKALVDIHKPKITAAVYKNRKETLDFDPLTDGPLLSDVLAKRNMELKPDVTINENLTNGSTLTEDKQTLLINGGSLKFENLQNDIMSNEQTKTDVESDNRRGFESNGSMIKI